MNPFDFINTYGTTIAILVGSFIYLLTHWKKGSSEAANNTIRLLQDEVSALKSRLDTTNAQVSQLTTQILEMNTIITTLKEENNTFRNLIKESLGEYFKHNKERIETIAKKFEIRG